MSEEMTTQEAWHRGSQGAKAAYARRRITVDPITRLEGHGKIDIFLDEAGEVERAFFQVPELRGFEKFAEGRPAEDMPQITSRICGVCPTAHHMAATKALDALYKVDPPPAAKKIRELVYSAFMAEDHALHFYFLGGPDFVVGPDAPAAQRNILGVIATVGQEAGLKVIGMRRRLREIITTVGGKVIHPVLGLPGGVAKRVTAEQQAVIKETAADAVDFARFTLDVFRSVVLANPAYVDLIVSDAFTHRTYYMGLMDDKNRPNFYDGRIRVVTPEGAEFAAFAAADYLEQVAEHVEPWSYVKFCYLKKVGWNGFTDGADSGIYSVAPLARLNVADGMATPLAQEAYEEMFATLGGKPVHHTLANHWARVVELLYATERLKELADDPELDRPQRAHPAHRDAARRRRGGRSAAGHPAPPLQDRLPGDHRAGQPDRGHPEQLGPHGDERGEGGQGPDLQGRGVRRHPQQDRDGFPGLRPLPCVRHPLPAGEHAAAAGDPRSRR